jgi:hypothetical protein
MSRARVTIAVEIAAVIIFIVAALGNPVAAGDTVRDLPGAMKTTSYLRPCASERSQLVSTGATISGISRVSSLRNTLSRN